jgi:hypothetical protein
MIFRIYGRYRGRTEEIDEAHTEREAERLVSEYRMAFGADWSVWQTPKGEAPSINPDDDYDVPY